MLAFFKQHMFVECRQLCLWLFLVYGCRRALLLFLSLKSTAPQPPMRHDCQSRADKVSLTRLDSPYRPWGPSILHLTATIILSCEIMLYVGTLALYPRISLQAPVNESRRIPRERDFVYLYQNCPRQYADVSRRACHTLTILRSAYNHPRTRQTWSEINNGFIYPDEAIKKSIQPISQSIISRNWLLR